MTTRRRGWATASLLTCVVEPARLDTWGPGGEQQSRCRAQRWLSLGVCLRSPCSYGATVKLPLKRTLLAALPLMGRLLTAPPTAWARHHHDCWSEEDRSGYGRPADDEDYEDRGYSADRYGDSEQPPYGGDPYAYGNRPSYGAPSPYGQRPYDGGGPAANPDTMDPSSLLPALLGLLHPGY
jgi:hypothetical protein